MYRFELVEPRLQQIERNGLRDARCVFVGGDVSSTHGAASSLTGAVQVAAVSVGAGAGAREMKNAIVDEGRSSKVVGTYAALDGGGCCCGCCSGPGELDGAFLFAVHRCLRLYLLQGSEVEGWVLACCLLSEKKKGKKRCSVDLSWSSRETFAAKLSCVGSFFLAQRKME